MTQSKILETTTAIVPLLEPLSPDERKRVLTAVFAILGDGGAPVVSATPDSAAEEDAETADQSTLAAFIRNPRTRRWATQQGLTVAILEQVYHPEEDGLLSILVDSVPGSTKKEQTIAGYLVVGLKAYLMDETRFADQEALDLCKHVGAYDRNNHTQNRRSLGNKATGSRGEGFALTGPGLRAAVQVVREIARATSDVGGAIED